MKSTTRLRICESRCVLFSGSARKISYRVSPTMVPSSAPPYWLRARVAAPGLLAGARQTSATGEEPEHLENATTPRCATAPGLTTISVRFRTKYPQNPYAKLVGRLEEKIDERAKPKGPRKATD